MPKRFAQVAANLVLRWVRFVSYGLGSSEKWNFTFALLDTWLSPYPEMWVAIFPVHYTRSLKFTHFKPFYRHTWLWCLKFSPHSQKLVALSTLASPHFLSVWLSRPPIPPSTSQILFTFLCDFHRNLLPWEKNSIIRLEGSDDREKISHFIRAAFTALWLY